MPFAETQSSAVPTAFAQSETFRQGWIAIYAKDIKFPADGDGPFQLVYVSPSFEKDAPGPLIGPLIYKINKEYIPIND